MPMQCEIVDCEQKQAVISNYWLVETLHEICVRLVNMIPTVNKSHLYYKWDSKKKLNNILSADTELFEAKVFGEKFRIGQRQNWTWFQC